MPVTRRHFLGAVAAAPVAWLAGAPLGDARTIAAPPLEVNAARLRASIEALSAFGRPAGGSFADGVTRLAYSEADVQARQFVVGLMREAGLVVRIDQAGNIIGARKGLEPGAAPLVLGSHIDSVPGGGNFDGDLGTLAAIEAVRRMREENLTTSHPLEIAVWVNEEGVAYGNGLCGSRALAGELEPGELDAVWNGVRKADAIRAVGGDPEHIVDARRRPGSIHAYLELHIEQGGVLDKAGIPIGVVEGIVAIDRYEAVVAGTANHAGTTPMPDRQDALVAAARLVLAVREVVTGEPGRQVGTVGQLQVTPNAPNVVPGLVRHTIELRDLSAEKVTRLAGQIRERARQIALETRTSIEIRLASHHDAALANPAVRAAIARSASSLDLPTLAMPSGAGHDAQMLARLGPMGMIFVPSVGGVSHSAREFTRWEDCARGAAVLLNAALALDRTTMPS